MKNDRIRQYVQQKQLQDKQFFQTPRPVASRNKLMLELPALDSKARIVNFLRMFQSKPFQNPRLNSCNQGKVNLIRRTSSKSHRTSRPYTSHSKPQTKKRNSFQDLPMKVDCKRSATKREELQTAPAKQLQPIQQKKYPFDYLMKGEGICERLIAEYKRKHKGTPTLDNLISYFREVRPDQIKRLLVILKGPNTPHSFSSADRLRERQVVPTSAQAPDRKNEFDLCQWHKDSAPNFDSV